MRLPLTPAPSYVSLSYPMRRTCGLLAALLAVTLTACNAWRNLHQSGQDEKDIRAAIDRHLKTRSNLRPDAMDMKILDFNTDRDTAVVKANFVPKQGGPTILVTYHLQRTNGVWEVTKADTAMGGGTPGAGPGSLPQGHPAVDSGTARAPESQSPKP